MSLNGNIGQQNRAQSLLDDVLKDRPAEYRARVLELVVRYGWDVDDPNFLILIATGQMEVLLDQFPEQFEELFVMMLGRFQAQGNEFKVWLKTERKGFNESIQALEMVQAQGRQTLAEQTEQLRAGISDQREWSQQQAQELLRLSKQEEERVEKVLKEKMKGTQKEFFSAAQRYANEIIDQSINLWIIRMKHEAFTWGAICSGLFFMLGLMFGVVVHMNFVDNFTDIRWANQLWNWNRLQHRKCVEEKKSTCTFYIKSPGN